MSTSVSYAIAIIVAILGSNGLWELIRYNIQKKDKKQEYVTKDELEIAIQPLTEYMEELKHASKVSMQDRLHSLMRKAINTGEITTYEFQLISNLYDAYIKDLDGNSFIKDLHEDYKESDIKIIDG